MDQSYILKEPERIISPALLYYPEKIRRNIDRMVQMAGGPERLCPHVKTYKCEKVVRMLMEAGIRFFKCATVAEAEMTARCGADRAVLAYPLVGPNISRFMELRRAFPETEFWAVGDDEGQVRLLAGMASASGDRVDFLMDMDMGQHRTGVSPEKAEALAEKIAEMRGIRFRGLHVYDGHHHESSEEKRRRAVEEENAEISRLRAGLEERGIECGFILSGGTPTFPCHLKTEAYLSPGTCVIQDAGYQQAYADLPFEPAAALLTRVVSLPGGRLFTLDLGTKAVASDPPVPRAVVMDYEDCITVTHNEEHLVLCLPEGQEGRLPEIGTALYAIPWHICPTTILYPEVLAVENGEVIGRWQVTARDRKLTI